MNQGIRRKGYLLIGLLLSLALVFSMAPLLSASEKPAEGIEASAPEEVVEGATGSSGESVVEPEGTEAAGDQDLGQDTVQDPSQGTGHDASSGQAADQPSSQDPDPSSGQVANQLSGQESDLTSSGVPDSDEGTPDSSDAPVHPYTEITDLIDALPELEAVMAMDHAGVFAANVQVIAIRDAIEVQLGSAVTDTTTCSTFDEALGEERILKFNELFAFTSEYLARNSMTRRSLPSTHLVVDGVKRYRIENTRVIEYRGLTATVADIIENISDGIVISGSGHYAGAIEWVPDKLKVIEVAPGTTTHLYLNGLDINMDNGTCIEVTKADVTLTLVDNTTNKLYVYGYYKADNYEEPTWNGGALVKNGMTGTLTIRCERAEEEGHMCIQDGPDRCGSLHAKSALQHVAAIGSSYYGGVITRTTLDGPRTENGGFSNLYITGGIIKADGGIHSPGIGSMCGTTYLSASSGTTATDASLANPQSTRGQICKDIHISGGRVYAYGGDGCAGIGSGWAGPVESIHISGGAYVYAEGGTGGGWNSPGIGSGGTTSDEPNRIRAPGVFSVSDIQISGGMTIVEALGSTHLQYHPNVSLDHRVDYVAGIGSGVSWNYINTSQGTLLGPVSNVNAIPESGWLSMIKQGTAKSNASFVNNSPNPAESAIATNRYYNLVYFTHLGKTARVSGAPADETGTAANPVPVQIGDEVIYKIDTANWAQEGGTYTLSDELPLGMTLVTTGTDTHSPGMSVSTGPNGRPMVQWVDQSRYGEFYFTVKVDDLPAGTLERDFVNQAVLTANGTISAPTNETYHHTEKPAAPPLAKITVAKVIDGFSGFSTPIQDDLAERLFIINLAGGVEASVVLKHGETSGELMVEIVEDSATIEVSEVVPMEFLPDYKIQAMVMHADGLPGKTQTDDSIHILPGDEIAITITNTFDHSPFFKDWAGIENGFYLNTSGGHS